MGQSATRTQFHHVAELVGSGLGFGGVPVRQPRLSVGPSSPSGQRFGLVRDREGDVEGGLSSGLILGRGQVGSGGFVDGFRDDDLVEDTSGAGVAEPGRESTAVGLHVGRDRHGEARFGEGDGGDESEEAKDLGDDVVAGGLGLQDLENALGFHSAGYEGRVLQVGFVEPQAELGGQVQRARTGVLGRLSRAEFSGGVSVSLVVRSWLSRMAVITTGPGSLRAASTSR